MLQTLVHPLLLLLLTSTTAYALQHVARVVPSTDNGISNINSNNNNNKNIQAWTHLRSLLASTNHRAADAAAAPASTSTSTPADAPRGMSGGAIAGIVVGALVLVFVLAGIVYFIRTRRSSSFKRVSTVQTMRVRRVNSTAKSAMGYARTEDSDAPAAAKPIRSNATEKVIIPYLATLPDELTVEVGELVQVVERFDDGWVKGRRVKTGHEGTFPGACVGYGNP
ncbi:hypothetical protein CcCBS67573_g05068 [Chytriomyces confervae]|uniref:SH3 domain-containing protein n=1 Tax=Chytriomyces confervae TaxID=246404 RepID=A0A507FBG4_9FUNG|nr:hypothetical protein HDU80_010261 [Chytriomyces hyalinus]TPX73679.1 hypothetical protein CcCBS67573_g05068 [Chytriomyces confervae]